jgi:hypothetical protein
MKQKSAAAKKLPTEQNAKQGIKRILIPNAIESNSTGKSAEGCAFELIAKVGRYTCGICFLVQRDGDRAGGGTCERGVPGRCRAKKLRVGHLKAEWHATNR